MSVYLVPQIEGVTPSHYFDDPAEGDLTVRISNPAAENGEPCSGPLSWLNSARVTADPDEDAVHCVVSVGDPRGGFCFTVRRCPDGTLLLSYPHPGEGLPHMETEASAIPGSVRVVGDFSDSYAPCEDCGGESEVEEMTDHADGNSCAVCWAEREAVSDA